MKYADIIVDISQESLDKTYQYIIPKEWSQEAVIGAPVWIPFGNGNRKIQGYIVNISDIPVFDVARMKSILAVQKDGLVIESQLIALAYWMKEQFGATMNDALKTVLPVKQKVKRIEKRSISSAIQAEELQTAYDEAVRKKHKAKERLFKELLTQGSLDFEVVVQKLNISRDTIRKLIENGIIKEEVTELYRNPIRNSWVKQDAPLLNMEQQQALDQMLTGFYNGSSNHYLLHGVTGSGKTEVYLAVMEAVVKSGKQAIMLIPEISLTYQTVMRFYRRFGDRISIMNSRLSKGERYDQMLRAEQGSTDVMIGPRSALFTPFPNLGLIIIDEEHEGSYKNEGLPKYHAREVAVKRAELAGAFVVFGTATPSVEIYTAALNGTYPLLALRQRAGEAALPKVYVVDLREELRNKNKSIFSMLLREKLKQRLQKNEQIILFLNRRGYAGFVSCRSCGLPVKCPHCDISLTYHKDGRLICHYCGHTDEMPTHCPVCQSPYIAAFGTGTQKVEEMLKKEFPSARILRMDGDTTKTKESYEQILSSFANQEADILLGTQMIVKGHDFPKVTLVGILAADLSLNAGNFRSSERTFQLLAQAAGRAGRAELPGEVVIQTYQPEHYSIQAAAKEDYLAFYEQEMNFRSLLGYPPFAHLLLVFCGSKNEEKALAAMKRLADITKEFLEKEECFLETKMIGPAPAAILKVNDIFRYTFYVKQKDYSVLVAVKNCLEAVITGSTEYSGCNIQFDFDPMSGY